MKKRRYGFEDRDYDDEEFETDGRKIKDKRKEKRFDRALKTKDLSALLEDEDEEDDWDYYNYGDPR
jgi:hypothetical protein